MNKTHWIPTEGIYVVRIWVCIDESVYSYIHGNVNLMCCILIQKTNAIICYYAYWLLIQNSGPLH